MDTRKVVVSGAKWTTLSTIVTTVVALLRLSILTRILDKADFGIVAILTFIVGLTQTFSDMGFSSAIMHRRDMDRASFSSLYWMQLSVFCVFYLIIALCSPLVASFYREPRLTYLLPLILLELIFVGIGRFYETLLQKNFQFKTIAVRNIVLSLLSLVLAVILALNGWGVYSLIYSTLFQVGCLNIYNFIVGQKQIKLQFTLSVAKSASLMKIGFYQTGTNIIDYFASKLDVFLMGRFLGMEALGVYSLAKELLVKAYSIINGIGNKVLLPIYSKMQDSTEELARIYLKSINLLTFISFPIIMAIGVFSTPIIDIFYGNKYEEAASLVPILALSYLGSCISNPVGSLTVAKGRTDTSFYYTIIRLLMSLPVVWITSTYSLICLAYGQLFLAIPGFFLVYYMMIRKYLHVSLKQYIFSFEKNLCFVLFFSGIFYFILRLNPFNVSGSLLIILVYGLTALVLYFILLCLIYRNNSFIIALRNKTINKFVKKKNK